MRRTLLVVPALLTALAAPTAAARSSLHVTSVLPAQPAPAQNSFNQTAPSQSLPSQSLPGQNQPVAPHTRPAPRLPTLTLTPPIPEVYKIEYLGNGSIEVAGAVLTVTPGDAARVRVLAAYTARRVLAERPSLSEVDVSVYDRASYRGFGGPLPLLTASVPRERLGEFVGWAAGASPGGASPGGTPPGTGYDRAWINSGANPLYQPPDNVREDAITFLGNLAERAADAVRHTTAKVQGGVQGGLLYRGSPRQDVTALTFDDAPHPIFEPLLLDLLRRGQVQATFFVIGRNARAYPYFVRDMVAAGHEVGNHTYHHVRLPPLPAAGATQEMALANQTISAITGRPVNYFRPPGGDYTPATLRAARNLGLTTVFWTDDPGDFQNPGTGVLLSRFARQLHRGGIALLHDNAPEMLQVLPAFIEMARQKSIALGTVSDLVGAGR